MDIFVSLKSIINRINKMDMRYKTFFTEKSNVSNPFNFSQNKTYVWVEKPKYNPQCDINFDENA